VPGKTAAKHKEAPKGPPNYVPIDPFTVNLQPGESGADQYLQLAFTLEVPSLEDVELIKNNNAKVRSRLLLLLSGKHAADINTPDGKKQLAAEILAQVKEPFEDKGSPQEVSDVLFTSFIIQ
jgi:flagellar FliL protein